VYSFGRGASIFSRVSYTRRDAAAVEFNVSQARSSAIVLFAHGARDPSWAEPFHRIVERLRRKQPATRVELAFLEGMDPPLESAIEQLVKEGADYITVVPLFLARGGHLKKDLPNIVQDIRQRHPSLRIHVSKAVGDSEELTIAIADWAFAQHAPPLD
jgi:sirohydrochlorin cobaltochelatase